MFYSSLKSDKEIFANLWALPTRFHYENYITAWQGGNLHIILGRYFLNSIIVVSLSLTLILTVSLLAAYALGRNRIINIKSKTRSIIYYIVALSVMIPPYIALIPLFAQLSSLHLYNTYWALVLPYSAFYSPLAIILFIPYFARFPDEIEEAAIIDGCSGFRMFWNIFLPILKPAVSSVAAILFVFIWNEFLFALVFIQDTALLPLTVGIFLSFKGQFIQYWGVLFSGLSIAILPVIFFYIFFNKQIVSGLAEGYSK